MDVTKSLSETIDNLINDDYNILYKENEEKKKSSSALLGTDPKGLEMKGF